MLDFPGEGPSTSLRPKRPCIIDHEPDPSARPLRDRLPGVAALVLLGMPGVLSLLLVYPTVTAMPRIALLANPALLLVVFAFAGAWAAPRAGLRSTIANGRQPLVPPHAAEAALQGGGLGLFTAVIDHATRSLWQNASLQPPSLIEGWQPGTLIAGILYGGVVEEIMMRWGLMSLILLACWKLVARRSAAPPARAVGMAMVLAASLFALGHLPMLAASGIALEMPLVARTLFWNLAAGILFGWTFARHDFESAMASHAGFHVGVFAAVAIEAMVS